MTPLSILDLAPILEGGDAADALRRSRDLAQHAERWGFRRFWLAEHHNLGGIASAATALAIGYVAEGTSMIRVGAGGIMLPNHAPLIIAEQFGTLASLYPGRIDLGIGRAPGTDQLTMRALRRTLTGDVDDFPRDVVELMTYFEPLRPGQRIQAVPGAGLTVPIWILGSSLYGASLAAALGLPFAFASHFAPMQMTEAIAIYRDNFQPSAVLAKPHLMLALNVFAADTQDDAYRISTSAIQAFANLRRGQPGPLPPPRVNFEQTLAPHERAALAAARACTVVGTADVVREGIESFVARTGADELIIASMIYDHPARLRSYEITASAGGLGQTR